jgi:hypothetical protein
MSGRTLLATVVVAVCTACAAPAAETPARSSLVEPVGTTASSAPAGPSPIEPVGTTASSAPAGPSPIEPVEILRAWDARRALAWAHGDPHLLRAFYTRGSVAGRHDRAMLRAWAARGLVVRGLRTQLLSVRPLAHTEWSWTLVVTDRLVGGLAVGAGVRRPLPRDQATTRTVRLVRVHGGWRVAAVWSS